MPVVCEGADAQLGWHKYVTVCFSFRIWGLTLPASVCTHLTTLVPYPSPIGTLRAQSSPLAHRDRRRLFLFHRVYDICLARTSLHLYPRRLKVFFAQKVELTDMSSAVARPQLTRVIT